MIVYLHTNIRGQLADGEYDGILEKCKSVQSYNWEEKPLGYVRTGNTTYNWRTFFKIGSAAHNLSQMLTTRNILKYKI